MVVQEEEPPLLSFNEARTILFEHFARSANPRVLSHVQSNCPHNSARYHSFWLNTHPDYATTSPLRSLRNPALQRVDLRAADGVVPLHFFLVTLTPTMDLQFVDLRSADDARAFLREHFPVVVATTAPPPSSPPSFRGRSPAPSPP